MQAGTETCYGWLNPSCEWFGWWIYGCLNNECPDEDDWGSWNWLTCKIEVCKIFLCDVVFAVFNIFNATNSNENRGTLVLIIKT